MKGPRFPSLSWLNKGGHATGGFRKDGSTNQEGRLSRMMVGLTNPQGHEGTLSRIPCHTGHFGCDRILCCIGRGQNDLFGQKRGRNLIMRVEFHFLLSLVIESCLNHHIRKDLFQNLLHKDKRAFSSLLNVHRKKSRATPDGGIVFHGGDRTRHVFHALSLGLIFYQRIALKGRPPLRHGTIRQDRSDHIGGHMSLNLNQEDDRGGHDQMTRIGHGGACGLLFHFIDMNVIHDGPYHFHVGILRHRNSNKFHHVTKNMIARQFFGRKIHNGGGLHRGGDKDI